MEFGDERDHHKMTGTEKEKNDESRKETGQKDPATKKSATKTSTVAPRKDAGASSSTEEREGSKEVEDDPPSDPIPAQNRIPNEDLLRQYDDLRSQMLQVVEQMEGRGMKAPPFRQSKEVSTTSTRKPVERVMVESDDDSDSHEEDDRHYDPKRRRNLTTDDVAAIVSQVMDRQMSKMNGHISTLMQKVKTLERSDDRPRRERSSTAINTPLGSMLRASANTPLSREVDPDESLEDTMNFNEAEKSEEFGSEERAPRFIIEHRASYEDVQLCKEVLKKEQQKTLSLSPNYTNNDLKEYLKGIDRRRYFQKYRDNDYKYSIWAIGEELRTSSKSLYVRHEGCTSVSSWDEYLSKMYRTFYSEVKEVRDKMTFDGMVQREKQPLEIYAYALKTMAIAADVEDKELCEKLWKTMLPKLKKKFPPGTKDLVRNANWLALIAACRGVDVMMTDLEQNISGHGGKIKRRMDENETFQSKKTKVVTSSKPSTRSRSNTPNRSSAPSGHNSKGVIDRMPDGLPHGHTTLHSVIVNGKMKPAPIVIEHRKKENLCFTCGGRRHSALETCSYPVYAQRWYTLVDPASDRNVKRVNSSKEDNSVTADVYLEDRVISINTLLDTGAEKSYIDESLVKKFGLDVRPVTGGSYNAIDASERVLSLITEEAIVTFGFGSHVETYPLHVMKLGATSIILGMNWLRYHDPDIRPSNNGYPKFDRDWCEGHVMNGVPHNSNFSVEVVNAKYPRAMSQVTAIHTIRYVAKTDVDTEDRRSVDPTIPVYPDQSLASPTPCTLRVTGELLSNSSHKPRIEESSSTISSADSTLR